MNIGIDLDIYGIGSFVRENGTTGYISPDNIEGLFMIDLENLQIHKICDFRWKNYGAVDLMKSDSDIWCVKRRGLEIYRYGVNNSEIEYYDEESDEQANMVSVLVGDSIFILPKEYPGEIVEFSLKNRSFHRGSQWMDGCSNGRIHLKAFCVDGNKVIATIEDYAGFIIYDLTERTAKITRIDIEDTFWGIVKTEFGYCMTSKTGGGIYNYFNDSNRMEFVKINTGINLYKQIFSYDNRLILSGEKGIDILTDAKKSICVDRELETRFEPGSEYLLMIESNKKIYMMPWNARDVICIDPRDYSHQRKRIWMSSKEFLNEHKTLMEGEITLSHFLGGI